jgi:carboxyl-terminal processing protease
MKRFFRILTAILLAVTMLISGASALTVEQALKLLESGYYFDIPAEAYEAEDVQSLVSVLGDPYTYYMDAETYQIFLESIEDTVDMVGIGVSIQYTEQGILVIEPLNDSSAQKAGILPGDLIVAIDGTP